MGEGLRDRRPYPRPAPVTRTSCWSRGMAAVVKAWALLIGILLRIPGGGLVPSLPTRPRRGGAETHLLQARAGQAIE